MKSDNQAAKENLMDLRRELYKAKADLIKWLIGTKVALAALIIYLLG